MKLNIFDVLKQPQITEKTTTRFLEEGLNKYTFRVHPEANKKQVKSAIEKIYNVHVTKVNTQNNSGKWRRVRHQPGKTASWKRAIVSLKKGEKIDITA